MNLGLQSVRPADVVLFLGAGASDFAGYKTFRGFGDLILDRVVRYQEQLPDIAPDTPRLVEEMRAALERVHVPATHDNYLWLLTDYRNFCEKFDTHTGLQSRFPRILDDIRSFRTLAATVVDDLTKTTFCHYSRSRDTGAIGEEIRSLYEGLAIYNSPTEPWLPMFTTNYDLLLEDLFADQNRLPARIPFSNGIPGRTRRGAKWNQKAYESGGLQLYRLHGCISWFQDNAETPGSSISFARPDNIDGSLLSRLCVMFPGREMELGRNPHGFGFRLLFAALLSCRKALFVGFSFRDDDVMQVLLAANASRETPLRLLMIDPRIGANDVLRSLEGAARRSPFPVRLPQESDISCLREGFGGDGAKEEVMNFVKST